MRKHMISLSAVLIVALSALSGTALFIISQKVQSAEKRMAALQKEIDRENETLRVYKAEWDYLNRPDRLEALATYIEVQKASDAATTFDSLNALTVNAPRPSRKPKIIPAKASAKPVIRRAAPASQAPSPAPIPVKHTEQTKPATLDDLLISLQGDGQ